MPGQGVQQGRESIHDSPNCTRVCAIYIFVTYIQVQPTYKYNLHTITNYMQVQPTYKYKLHASTTYIQVQTTYKYNLHTRICSTFKTLIIVVDFEEHKNSLW